MTSDQRVDAVRDDIGALGGAPEVDDVRLESRQRTKIEIRPIPGGGSDEHHEIVSETGVSFGRKVWAALGMGGVALLIWNFDRLKSLLSALVDFLKNY